MGVGIFLLHCPARACARDSGTAFVLWGGLEGGPNSAKRDRELQLTCGELAVPTEGRGEGARGPSVPRGASRVPLLEAGRAGTTFLQLLLVGLSVTEISKRSPKHLGIMSHLSVSQTGL